mmetsp:Transcript_44169/g.104556  ORF Transcript_44169/g.104556 Transcript_44169/m.104556 type:complete len:253 (+) Transcript_44169:397-1155(+)
MRPRFGGTPPAPGVDPPPPPEGRSLGRELAPSKNSATAELSMKIFRLFGVVDVPCGVPRGLSVSMSTWAWNSILICFNLTLLTVHWLDRMLTCVLVTFMSSCSSGRSLLMSLSNASKGSSPSWQRIEGSCAPALASMALPTSRTKIVPSSRSKRKRTTCSTFTSQPPPSERSMHRPFSSSSVARANVAGRGMVRQDCRDARAGLAIAFLDSRGKLYITTSMCKLCKSPTSECSSLAIRQYNEQESRTSVATK